MVDGGRSQDTQKLPSKHTGVIRHDPVYRHVPDSAGAASVAVSRAPLPCNRPRHGHRFGRRAPRRLRFGLGLGFRVRPHRGPYKGFSRRKLGKWEHGNIGAERGHQEEIYAAMSPCGSVRNSRLIANPHSQEN